MTEQELRRKLKLAADNYQKNKNSIYKEYALSNNPYKVGDIITDHNKTIIIERIEPYVGLGLPQCAYTGTQLNKDGTVRKIQADTVIYQDNIVSEKIAHEQ